MTDAQELTRALEGEWRGSSGAAPCPICQPESRRDQRALSITTNEGRLLVHCHKSRCAVFAHLCDVGLIKRKGRRVGGAAGAERALNRAPRRTDTQRSRRRRLFYAASRLHGTPAETYLATRGLTGKWDRLRKTLRFHPRVYNAEIGTGAPALLAAVTDARGNMLGLHRTWLAPDGSDKAPLATPRKSWGPIRGGAVRFAGTPDVLILAEGIETAMTLWQATGRETWATLSTSGLTALVLDPRERPILIGADHDAAGLEAAEAKAGRLEDEGADIALIAPSLEGWDFNDLARRRG